MKTTKERLNAFLELMPVEAKKSLGQNFLVSDSVVEKIIHAVAHLKPSSLIEIGPGPGALTDHLLEMKKPITLIELDRQIAQHWRALGQEVVEIDALHWDWEKINAPEETVLVSNLPYQISSSLVIDRSMDQKPLKAMVLMFQKEVAQRIRALPSTEDYGMLSVIVQNFWKTSVVSEAGPRDFSPAPRVASRVLQFTPLKTDIKDRPQFLKFIKACFFQRRKQLKNNLSSLYDSKQLAEILQEWKKPITLRAEELKPSEFKDLYFRFQLE